ncbi:MAG: class I SAM-dependent methyltransferase, partial [Proteobacteria bacterium]|nr:class I SAM-dependent methyltransferase [Pseudomonadota bacterium]
LPAWRIETGSVLDDAYMAGLGKFDIVYSWGVLHHTGEMWRAIINASRVVGDGGLFYIAIYNDQGLQSRLWWVIKYIYNRLPRLLRPIYAIGLDVVVVGLLSFKYAVQGKLGWFLRQRLHLSKKGGPRGVKVYNTEIYDWYGGFPFEFATHAHVKDFVVALGFRYVRGVQPGSLGCNEFVFQKTTRAN